MFFQFPGYKFDFPFLTPECKVRIEGRRVMPLYKHLIHTELPTICFVGLPFKVLPFPLFHFQVIDFILDGVVSSGGGGTGSNGSSKQ
jgi:hypothetical protein